MTGRDTDTVTLSRAEYEALLERAEDAEDSAVILRRRALEAEIGKERARANYLDISLVKRLLKGESPVRIWREHRKMTLRQLSDAAGVPQGYLSEIETGKKPGSFEAMTKIAGALAIPLDDLATKKKSRR